MEPGLFRRQSDTALLGRGTEKAIETLSLYNASGRKSLFLAFWPRQKAKLGLGEGF